MNEVRFFVADGCAVLDHPHPAAAHDCISNDSTYPRSAEGMAERAIVGDVPDCVPPHEASPWRLRWKGRHEIPHSAFLNGDLSPATHRDADHIAGVDIKRWSSHRRQAGTNFNRAPNDIDGDDGRVRSRGRAPNREEETTT